MLLSIETIMVFLEGYSGTCQSGRGGGSVETNNYDTQNYQLTIVT